MSDDLLEYLGLAAAGVALYLVAQNNAPVIKKAVSNIHSTISNIIPVCTEALRDERSPSPRGICPEDMYPDYTDGILHCHSSGGTIENHLDLCITIL
jgi:hypothetical protein